MKNCLFIFAVAMLVMHNVSALDLNDVRKFKSIDAGKLIFSMGFDASNDEKIEPLQKTGYKIVSSAGRNGTKGLVYERRNPQSYELGSIRLPELDKNTEYIIKLYARAEWLKLPEGQDDIGILCWESHDKKGDCLTGIYPKNPKLSSDWEEFTIIGRCDKNAASSNLVFYLRQGVTGKIFFDDVQVCTVGKSFTTIMLKPNNLTSWSDNGKFLFQVEKGTPKDLMVWITLKNAGQVFEKLLPVDAENRVAVDFGKLAVGNAQIEIKLADYRKKAIIGTQTFNVTVRTHEKSPSNAATLDDHDRLIVDGKPFMPLGVFINHSYEPALKQVSDAGFNLVLPYSILVNHEMLLEEKNRTGDIGKEIELFMDLAQKNHLKVIFNLKSQLDCTKIDNTLRRWGETTDRSAIAEKAVRQFQNHPALLAWYLNDETPQMYLSKVVKLRELVSRIDCWHPTVSLTYEYKNLPNYAISGDVFSYDCYPIAYDKTKQSLREMLPGLKAARDAGVPHWMTPQIFNWAIYRLEGNNISGFRNSYFPTAEEIRAMPLLAAIYNAKGFIFYMYDCAVPYVDQRIPGGSAREWPKIQAMAQVMRDLEPFIMSTEKAPEVKIECAPEGEVEARAFVDENRNIRVVMVGLGQPCKAIITIPAGFPELKSKFGKTHSLGNGRYEFTASAVDSDILGN